MTHEEVEAIIGGYHGDPFRILGPHAVGNRKAKRRWEVRAFLPQAKTASVMLDGVAVLMKKEHPHGFYVGTLDGDIQAYRLKYERWTGECEEIEDPYRFPTLLSDFELHLHGEGTNYETYSTLGAHFTSCEGVHGVRFAVWAPNAISVSVASDFNDWEGRRHPMRLRSGGIWELFIPNMRQGTAYKYDLRSKFRGYHQQKADPYGSFAKCRRNPPQ